jgi:hypothetical protein
MEEEIFIDGTDPSSEELHSNRMRDKNILRQNNNRIG